LVRRARRQAEISGLRLDVEIATDRTRSDLERDFLSLCRRFGLPAPEVNVKVGRWTVDFSELQVNDSAEEVAADLRDALGLAS
jgi:hypothetical protein